MKPLDVLSTCFSTGSTAHARQTKLWENFVWEDLIKTAEEQLVLPALQSRLRELGASAQPPRDISDFFSAVEELNLERNDAIFTELAAVASLLNAVGIEPVLLKGAAYCATGVYPNSALRYLWDIDLLIPERQMPTAVATLKQNGFESQESYRLGHFRHHHPPLQRKGAVHFELHHSVGMGICKTLLPASEMIEQSSVHDFRGTKVRIPSPEHMMVHLIMHSQCQHPYHERIWPPLRAMYDLVLLRRRFTGEIDWAAIEGRFHHARQSAVLELHVLQVQESLGAETPFPIRLNWLTRLRWLRRKLLRTLPPLRFLDPIYMYSTLLLRRLRLLRTALEAPGGWRRIARELFAADFYKRFVTDIIQGYGR